MYQFWVIQLLHLFLANFGIFAFVYIKSKKCYQSSAEGLLGYSAAIFAITSHNIYSNTLHSWIPRNIMGGIRKKISWHPELSQLLLLSLFLTKQFSVYWTVRQPARLSQFSVDLTNEKCKQKGENEKMVDWKVPRYRLFAAQLNRCAKC